MERCPGVAGGRRADRRARGRRRANRFGGAEDSDRDEPGRCRGRGLPADRGGQRRSTPGRPASARLWQGTVLLVVRRRGRHLRRRRRRGRRRSPADCVSSPPYRGSDPIGYTVLAIGVMLDTVALIGGVRPLLRQATERHMPLTALLWRGTDPAVTTVVLGSAAGLAGGLVAGVGLAGTAYRSGRTTGSGRADAPGGQRPARRGRRARPLRDRGRAVQSDCRRGCDLRGWPGCSAGT